MTFHRSVRRRGGDAIHRAVAGEQGGDLPAQRVVTAGALIEQPRAPFRRFLG